ncbi:hypothetical protein BST91_04950 [Nonlabens tegetincola]|uniref:DUF805 domain-containing protein n=1 Tax=Nonlabens tegetincola TaxID=323273 RepID=UPI000A20257A|nr:DUF805 domain-containing protein [Nonlabens tegetincola]ARN71042.1 hypothetical protein BST91_04950 [Nonlabens tegetincola]
METIPSQPEYRSRRNREPFKKESDAYGIKDSLKDVFNKYAVFTGRSRRSEYWFLVLFNILVVFGLYLLLIPFAVNQSEDGLILILILWSLYMLTVFIPSLAVTVRRLHDTGRSGWNYFLSLIPFVGSIILIIYLAEDSQPGHNNWGPNPKGIGNNTFNFKSENNPSYSQPSYEKDAFKDF